MAVILIAMFSTGIGYFAGRNRLLGYLRDRFIAEIDAVDALALPSGPAKNVGEAATYFELNAVFDKQLQELRDDYSLWPPLLETQNSHEQAMITEQIRRTFMDSLEPFPETASELNVQKDFWFSKEGVDFYLVRLSTHPSVSLQSVLMIPQDTLSTERPALLVLHGYDGNLQSVIDDIDYHHGFGFELAKNGFVVLAPLRVATTIDTHSTLNIKSLASGLDLETMNLQQLISAVDFLLTLDYVDPEHIGVYGVSLGGQHALRLSALDQRLSLVVSSGYFTDRFAWLFMRTTPSAASPPGEEMANFIHPLDHLLLSPSMGIFLDDINLVALIQPRHFLIESGKSDPRHAAAVDEFSKVSELYNHMGYPDRTAFIAFDGYHETSVESTLPYILNWAESKLITN